MPEPSDKCGVTKAESAENVDPQNTAETDSSLSALPSLDTETSMNRTKGKSTTMMSKEGSDFQISKHVSEKSESTTTLIHLKKELGLWNGIGIIVGTMIGSGIFVSPGTVVKYSGSVGMSLIVWVLTGLMSMVGALCFAELGTMIPKSGGDYAYVLDAFGPVPAFLILWTNITIATPAARAIGLITFATYLLQPLLPGCVSPPFWAVRLVALALLWFVGYINCAGVKIGAKLQDSLTLMKLLALVVIIAVGIHHLAYGYVENYRDPMEGTITNPASIATAFYASLFAYGGWSNLNSMTEELKDHNRNLPWAIAISLVTVTIIYVLTNVAYFAVLTPAEIVSSGAVAVTFGNQTLGVIAWIISIFVACSTFGNLNGSVIAMSRVMYVGAREGQLPKCLSLIHVHNHTPVTSIISTLIIPAFMLLAPDFATILAYTSFTRSLMSLLCIFALLWLRYKEPERPRPIKVWLGFPILYLILCIFVSVFPIIQRPIESGVAVGVFVVGLLVYYFAIHLRLSVVESVMDKVTYVCQMIFQSVEEEKTE